MALGQLVVRLGLDATDFVQGMSRSEAEAQRLAKKMAKDIADAATAVSFAFGAIAVGAATAFKLINDQVENIAAFQQLSEKIGDTAENLASLKTASDVSGTSMDSIAAASVKLTAALSKTDEEGQGAAKAIKALGLDFNDFKALSPVEQIDAVALAMNGFEDGANKTAVAVALWGKSGADMIPLLNDLADGSQRQITLTQDQITAADNFSKSIARLTSDAGTLKQQLAAQLIPTLSDLVKLFTSSGDESSAAANKARPFASAMSFIADEIRKTVATTFELVGGFKQVGVALSGFYANVKANLSGDFVGAAKIADETKAKIASISKEYAVLANTARAAGNVIGGGPLSGASFGEGGAAPKKNSLAYSGIKEPKAGGGKSGGADKLSEADKYLANLQRQLEATEKLTVVEALQRDITLGRLGVLLPGQQASLLSTAALIDAKKRENELWELEKKSILEVMKSDAERTAAALAQEKERAAFGESLRLSVQTQTEELIALEGTYRDAINQKIISQETFERLMGKVRERYDALTPSLLNFNDLAKTGAESLSSGLADAIVQGKSLADVFKNVVKQLAAMILKALIFKAIEIGLNAVVPGLGTAIAGTRATGGPVNAGKSYLVGEKGPELFSPNNSGKITTNAQTFRPQGGGGLTNVYNISAPGVSREEFTAGLNRSQAAAVSDVRDNKLRRRA